MQGKQEPFRRALAEFTKDLSPQEQNEFRLTSINDLKVALGKIQSRHESQRCLQNLNRLSGFFEVMEQYGKVIEVFGNSSEFIGFIWGPIKFVLQTASHEVKAFSAVLEIYQQIGECMPQFAKYESLFLDNGYMCDVLYWLYIDILEFHRKAIKFFKQKIWIRLFQATWKTFNSRFSKIVNNLQRHKLLVETQASLAQFEQLKSDRLISEAKFEEDRQAEELRRRNYIFGWLSAADSQMYQEKGTNVRNAYPGSGRWLLNRQQFREWFNSVICTRPLLSIVGKPGAGKTVLASLIIEQAQLKHPEKDTVYFYCRHGDPNRSTFLGLARGLLRDLLLLNGELLEHMYSKASSSGAATLTSMTTAKELLETCLLNFEHLYIVIDGLDECSRSEYSSIMNWFQEQSKLSFKTESNDLRCLFIGQEVKRKACTKLPTMKIRPTDMNRDIAAFTKAETRKIQHRFQLVPKDADEIAENISERADGMFLYAKLVMDNLLCQPNRSKLKMERDSSRLPKTIFEAYERIFHRVFADDADSELLQQREEVLRLLSWLVCAKRPFYWHEIQGAMAIDLKRQMVDTDLHLVKDSKELCGSLIEILPGNLIELVHSTARDALIHYKHVQQGRTNLELAHLCTLYLSFPGFFRDQTDEQIAEHVFAGYYAFQDYALAHWVDHLKAGIVSVENTHQLDELTGSLENFLPSVESITDVTETVPTEASNQNLHVLQGHRCFLHLVRVATSQKHPQHSINDTSNPLLYATVTRIRTVLESSVSSKSSPIADFYGTKLFKCPRLNCRAFYEGFRSSETREQHVARHDRPLLCTVDENCLRSVMGFATSRELQRHIDEAHATPTSVNDDEFPDLMALEEVIAENASKPPEQTVYQTGSPTSRTEEEQETQSGEILPTMAEAPARKRRRRRIGNAENPTPADRQKHPATYECSLCPKKFTRAYNLRGHLRSHTNEKPYKCTICSACFARENDRKRHETRHTGNRRYACPGCSKHFTRSDELQSHLQTQGGQQCTLHLASKLLLNLNKPRGSAPIPMLSSETVAAASHAPNVTSSFNVPQSDSPSSFAMDQTSQYSGPPSVLPSISNLLNPTAPMHVETFLHGDDFSEEHISLDFSGFDPGFDLMHGSAPWFNEGFDNSGQVDEAS